MSTILSVGLVSEGIMEGNVIFNFENQPEFLGKALLYLDEERNNHLNTKLWIVSGSQGGGITFGGLKPTNFSLMKPLDKESISSITNIPTQQPGINMTGLATGMVLAGPIGAAIGAAKGSAPIYLFNIQWKDGNQSTIKVFNNAIYQQLIVLGERIKNDIMNRTNIDKNPDQTCTVVNTENQISSDETIENDNSVVDVSLLEKLRKQAKIAESRVGHTVCQTIGIDEYGKAFSNYRNTASTYKDSYLYWNNIKSMTRTHKIIAITEDGDIKISGGLDPLLKEELHLTNLGEIEEILLVDGSAIIGKTKDGKSVLKKFITSSVDRENGYFEKDYESKFNSEVVHWGELNSLQRVSLGYEPNLHSIEGLIGITKEGKVVATSNMQESMFEFWNDISEWEDIVSIVVTEKGKGVIGLTKQGNIITAGEFDSYTFEDTVATWKNIVQIYTGRHILGGGNFIVALRANGTCYLESFSSARNYIYSELNGMRNIAGIVMNYPKMIVIGKDGILKILLDASKNWDEQYHERLPEGARLFNDIDEFCNKREYEDYLKVAREKFDTDVELIKAEVKEGFDSLREEIYKEISEKTKNEEEKLIDLNNQIRQGQEELTKLGLFKKKQKEDINLKISNLEKEIEIVNASINKVKSEYAPNLLELDNNERKEAMKRISEFKKESGPMSFGDFLKNNNM